MGSTKKDKYEKLVSLLIENFVNLQKIFTKTSEKFEELSEQISKLLQLFEISAKSFSEKIEEKVSEIEKDKKFLEKLEELLQQNKLIAKGLTLLEERIRERMQVLSGVPKIISPEQQKVPFKIPSTYSSQSSFSKTPPQTQSFSPSIIEKEEKPKNEE